MARRGLRVSDAQWSLLLGFLELHPNMARPRAYNNSAQGRAESLRLWEEVAVLLNREGTIKTAREWSTYVSNYKSRLRKTIADINAEATGTAPPPVSPQSSSLSDLDQRFLAVFGTGLGLPVPRAGVDPFPIEVQQAQQPKDIKIEEVLINNESPVPSPNVEAASSRAVAPVPPLPQQTWQRLAHSGGPNPVIKIEPGLIIDGRTNIYDSHDGFMAEYQQTIPEENIEVNITSNGQSDNTQNPLDEDMESTLESRFVKRTNILRKKRDPALSHNGSKRKTSLNDTFKRLSEAKLELVKLQKAALENDYKHKQKLQEMELQGIIEENKFKETMRKKELELIQIKINNAKNNVNDNDSLN